MPNLPNAKDQIDGNGPWVLPAGAGIPDHVPGYREIMRFAFPLMISLLTTALMALIDTMFIGRLGRAELAAVPLAALVYLVGWIAMVGLMRNSIAFVGRFFGAGRLDEINPVMGQYRLLALAGFPLLLLYIQAWPFFARLAELSDVVEGHAWVYLSWRIWDVPFSLLLVLYSSFFQALGNSRFPMLVNLLVLLMNVVLDYGLIFGHFGFPAMGVAGSALATIFAQIFGAVVIVVSAHRGALGRSLNLRLRVPLQWFWLKDILRIGLPQAVGDFLEVSAWAGFGLIVGRLGEVSLAANNIGFQATHILFLPGFALGIAASSYMGRFLGAGRADMALAATKRTLLVGLSYMGLLGIPLWFWGEVIAGAFTSDPLVMAQAALMFKVMALYQVFDGAGFITRVALSGAGDTRWPTLVLAVCVFGVMFPGALLLSRAVQPGLVGAWLGAFIYMVVLASLMLIRLQRGKWQVIRLHPAAG